jgi:hypothetical protein
LKLVSFKPASARERVSWDWPARSASCAAGVCARICADTVPPLTVSLTLTSPRFSGTSDSRTCDVVPSVRRNAPRRTWSTTLFGSTAGCEAVGGTNCGAFAFRASIENGAWTGMNAEIVGAFREEAGTARSALELEPSPFEDFGRGTVGVPSATASALENEPRNAVRAGLRAAGLPVAEPGASDGLPLVAAINAAATDAVVWVGRSAGTGWTGTGKPARAVGFGVAACCARMARARTRPIGVSPFEPRAGAS